MLKVESTLKSKNMSNEEKVQLDERKRINDKVRQVADAFEKDIKANNKTKGGSVYLYNNAWVVKPHHYTPIAVDLGAD